MNRMEESDYEFEPLPEDLIVYAHQIGGHGLINVKLGKVFFSASALGNPTGGLVLHGQDNTIFKPIQAYPKGRTEIEFYRAVFDQEARNRILSSLRSFVPVWRGLYFDRETKTRYLRLEDVLAGMNLPSVADIKIGAVSFEPNAAASKVAIEKAKYFWREEVGFLITGMKIYNTEKNAYDYFDRFQGRGLNPEEVYSHGIRFFVGPSAKRALVIAKNILSQLLVLRAWFDSQTTYAFYASSLLLAYDGVPLEGQPVERTVVKWVDFTHMVTVHQRDDNFLYGLANLIKYFERLVETEVAAPYVTEAPGGSNANELPAVTPNNFEENHKPS